MLPTKSNTADQGCSPVSSNCVIWQGPSLSCINLCNGDTVSDVVYKLAVELCDLKDQLDLSDLDLACVVQACQTCPEPVKTLSAVLDLIITKTCDLELLIDDLANGSGEYIEPNLSLPACLQYVNAQGQNVTSVAHSTFSSTMATKICAMNTLVNNHTSQITGHENRIVVLENKTADLLPTIVPNCVFGSDVTSKTLNITLDALEDQFCLLRGTLGTTTAITAAAAQQCAGLASAPAFGQSGTLGNITGWKSSVTTLSDSFNNLWITVCDMRAAVRQVLDAAGGSGGCAGFILKFAAFADNSRQNVTLIFNNFTTIPAGFTDCDLAGAVVTIKDSVGKTFTSRTVISTAINNTSGVTFALASSGLNFSSPYTITVDACVIKDGASCNKSFTETILVPCPTVTGVTATLA
jgi:hypothetical protein